MLSATQSKRGRGALYIPVWTRQVVYGNKHPKTDRQIDHEVLRIGQVKDIKRAEISTSDPSQTIAKDSNLRSIEVRSEMLWT